MECTIDYCFDEKEIVVETAEANSDVAGAVVVVAVVNIECWEDWGTLGVDGVLVVDTFAVATVAVVDTDKGVCIAVVEGTSYTVVVETVVDDTVVVVVVEFGDVVAEKTAVDGIAEPSSFAVVGDTTVVDVIW